MRRAIRLLAPLCAAGLLAACASQGNTMLVFGQTQTVGIAIGGSATDQGLSFTLGYQDRNFAIVPASVRQADGNATQVVAKVGNPDTKVGQGEDALSVLGQFSVSTSSKTADVGLGKFFATGLAAQKLADGFRDQLSASASKAPPAPAAASAAAK
jgi:hypothetical protein